MGTKEEAAIIREEFKRKGWSSKMVSVRIHLYSMGSSINVTLNDSRVPFYEAKAIAECAEKIDRDGWGEILSGGNRFVSVYTSDEYERNLGAPHVAALELACEQLVAHPSDSVLMPIGDSGVLVGWDNGHRGMWMRLWSNHAEMSFDGSTVGGRLYGAFHAAKILQRLAFEQKQAERLQPLRPTG